MGTQHRVIKGRNTYPRKVTEGTLPPYPIKFEPKNLDEVRCPECGARTSCYACATSGGWMPLAEIERAEDEMAIEPPESQP
jgi:hypothetical protein